MCRGPLPPRITGSIIQYSLEMKRLYGNSTTNNKHQFQLQCNFQIKTQVGNHYTEIQCIEVILGHWISPKKRW